MQPKKIAIIGADYPIYEKYCPNFTGMKEGLRTLNIAHKLFGCRPALDLDALIEYKPDLIIYGLIDMVKNRLLRLRIKELLPDAKIVMWYGDYRGPETGGQTRYDLSEIDAMFVSNNAQNEYYKEVWKVKECHFLPLGCQIYDPEYNPELAYDIVFIGGLITGNGFLSRAQSMLDLRSLGLHIINGPADNPSYRAKIMKNMPAIYRSSKVCLDASHFTNINGYTSNRFWIVTASGGFALTKRFPGCEEFYPEGTRVYFDSFDDVMKIKDYYLSHPEEREKIRRAGYEHAKNHTYDKRFIKMFEIIYGKGTQN